MLKHPKKYKVLLTRNLWVYHVLEEKNMPIVWQLLKMEQSILGAQDIRENWVMIINGLMRILLMSLCLDKWRVLNLRYLRLLQEESIQEFCHLMEICIHLDVAVTEELDILNQPITDIYIDKVSLEKYKH